MLQESHYRQSAFPLLHGNTFPPLNMILHVEYYQIELLVLITGSCLCLYQSDKECLVSENWLTDSVITASLRLL